MPATADSVSGGPSQEARALYTGPFDRELEHEHVDSRRRNTIMAKPSAHRWEFRARFRRQAFGWKSQPAIKRVKEAVSEIKKVARKDKMLAAEGAVLFLEKVSPALERVDSSSGAIGTAVNNAIEALVAIIAVAPADEKTRDDWLERLWEAYQDDGIPYIERLGDYWGELCASKETASRWADQLMGTCKMAWSPNSNLRGFFKGTTNCLSALYAAQRYDELLELLDLAPFKMWHYRQYGVKALAALGNKAEAIRYAEEGSGLNDRPSAIARACEEILLSAGLADEAYARYGLLANQAGTYTAWFRAIAKKYPLKTPSQILHDLVAETPGEEGKWFAAAKDAKLFDEAIALANRSPCSPQTLTRAARDFEEKQPEFAIEVGMAALRWLVEGYGYEITGLDVLNAYSHTMQAAENAGCADQTRQRIHDLVVRESFGDRFVTKVLGRHLGMS
jgi:tetratricopeptide (TPR) repeat protein